MTRYNWLHTMYFCLQYGEKNLPLMEEPLWVCRFSLHFTTSFVVHGIFFTTHANIAQFPQFRRISNPVKRYARQYGKAINTKQPRFNEKKKPRMETKINERNDIKKTQSLANKTVAQANTRWTMQQETKKTTRWQIKISLSSSINVSFLGADSKNH